MRLRTIKKYGNTFVIRLTRADIKDLELKEGDEVNIEDFISKKNTVKDLKGK